MIGGHLSRIPNQGQGSRRPSFSLRRRTKQAPALPRATALEFCKRASRNNPLARSSRPSLFFHPGSQRNIDDPRGCRRGGECALSPFPPRFSRPNTTSGGTGGATTHTHTVDLTSNQTTVS